MGKHLGLPEYIMGEKPSQETFKGISDDDIIGHKYAVIDLVAYTLENGLDGETIVRAGVSRDEIESIKRLHELSARKRENEHECPFIDV